MAELYLRFGRVNVDIKLLRRQGDIDYRNRVLAVHEQAVIGILRCTGQQWTTYPPSIDEEAEIVAIGTRQSRRAR